MAYRSDWMDEEVDAVEVSTSEGFGTVWLVHFPDDEPKQEEELELGQEEDAKEAQEAAVARQFKSRYLVIRGDGSEIWTSSPEEANKLLGTENTLFG